MEYSTKGAALTEDEIRKLAQIMKDMGLSSLKYSTYGTTLEMERPSDSIQASVVQNSIVLEQFESSRADPAGGDFTVKSPMVGVFYSAPGTDKPPYVSPGDKVSVGDVLCIIEAMKIMNEITAERDGVITEIFAENKQVVEFGQPLFRISAGRE